MTEKLLNYFKGDDLASSAWKSKYAKEGEETPDDMHRRMAKNFARIESNHIETEKDGSNTLSKYGRERNPLTEESIYNLFKDFKYIIPQGSVMSNLGAKEITSLSNCLVVASPEDSYGGIFKADQELAQLMKRRAGVGVDISTLRPEGTSTSNAAKTSTGAISFMHRFSNTTREVAQNGRRGALMLSININHPDVLEFIKIKRDLSQVTGANISVKLNDEFMKAVENDEDYILRFPCDMNCSTKTEFFSSLPYNELVENKPDSTTSYFKRIKAKEYWDEIIKSAHGVAEPGLMFWDNMVDYSPDGVYEEFKQVTTNPCCFSTKDRVDVITQDGIKDIKSITPKDLVWLENEHKFVPTKGYTNYGEAEVYTVKFSNGEEFNVTNNHKFAKISPKRIGTKLNKESFELVELKDLNVGDEIRVHNSKSLSFGQLGSKEEGQLLGWLSGDGCLSYANEGDNFPTMYLDFWKKEYNVGEKLLEYIHSLNFNNTLLEFKNNGNTVKRIASSRLTQHFTEKYETNLWRFRKGRNEFLYNASQEFVQGYLAAYFTADGTIQNIVEQSRFNVSLSSIDLDRLKQVQSLLLNFGIKSSVALSKKAWTNNDNSFENSKDCYRLTITGITNIKLFKEYIGFMTEEKQNKLDDICNKDYQYEKSLDYTKIVSIEYKGIEEVGCIEVPDYNYFTANSIISGNSEIAMQPYDACRLIAVNLFSFVDKPFTKEAAFDYQKFYEINYEAMRLSDDLIDLELEHINRIIEKIKKDPESEIVKTTELELWENVKKTAMASRRTGLGFTALGDTLAALGLKYDSDEALDTVESIMRTKMDSELTCTTDLAILRGTFEGWDKNVEFKHNDDADLEGMNDFYKFICDNFPKQAKRLYYYGRRNVSFSTVAPTGTVSLLAQTTSGIEPLFQPFYIRRKKVNRDDKDVRVDFTDQNGDTWQEFPVLHQRFKEWINSNFDSLGLSGQQDIEDEMSQEDLQIAFEKSPWYGSTANDIDWVKRVRMQSIIQKYVTHSISSTINLPEDVTEEEVSEIYLESWKQGVKGITVYRDGSRSGVLVTNTEPKETFTQHDAPKRPKKLECDVHTTVSKGVKWNVFVGLLENKPYEVFAVPYFTDIEKGFLVKVKKGRYDLLAENEETYSEDVTSEMNSEQEVVTRLTSTSLRHGADIKFVVEQLNKSYGDITSFSKAVARVLKRYIPDGTKSSVSCNECNSTNVIFEEGCNKCLDCGSSKCS